MGSKTNDLTNDIIKSLFRIGIFAFRQNILPIPISRAGQVVGYRPPPIAGIPDIQAIVPGGLCTRWPCGGGNLFYEIKIGADKLRESQLGFIANAGHCGAVILIIKTPEEFLEKTFGLLDLLSADQKKLLCQILNQKIKSPA